MPHPFAAAILDAPADTNGDAAPQATGAPSNQQILDCAKAAYATYQPVVDALALAVVASVKDANLAAPLAALDAAGPQVTPALTTPFFGSPEIATALGVATRNSRVKSISVGAFANDGPTGPSVVGYAKDVLGITDPVELLVTLDLFKNIVTVDAGENLQYGIWLPGPTQLHDSVLGMYVNTTIQTVSVNLKVLLTSALAPYGFMASTGAEVPIPSGVFSGATSNPS